MKTKKLWIFFFHIDRGVDQYVYDTVECIAPERTKIYKELRKIWCQRNDITSIGYTNGPNETFLVWPQSTIGSFGIFETLFKFSRSKNKISF